MAKTVGRLSGCRANNQDLGFQSGDKVVIEEHGGALLIKAVTDEITERKRRRSGR